MPAIKQKNRGFTIVELLIVIVVIGILAAITIVAYNGVQQRARVAHTDNGINLLLKAIHAARINKDATLREITGTGCTSCNDTDGTKMHAAIDKIGAAAGMDLGSLKAGDGWGDAYRLDENEGEPQLPPCSKDALQLTSQATKVAAGVKMPAIPTYAC